MSRVVPLLFLDEVAGVRESRYRPPGRIQHGGATRMVEVQVGEDDVGDRFRLDPAVPERIDQADTMVDVEHRVESGPVLAADAGVDHDNRLTGPDQQRAQRKPDPIVDVGRVALLPEDPWHEWPRDENKNRCWIRLRAGVPDRQLMQVGWCSIEMEP